MPIPRAHFVPAVLVIALFVAFFSVPVTAQSSSPTINYLDFDNTNDLVQAGSASLPSQFTIEAWILPRSDSTDMIFTIRDTDNNPNMQFRLRPTKALSLLTTFENSGTSFGNWVSPSNSINLSAWQHVAVVYNGTSAANDPLLYINGVLQNTTEQNTPSGTLRTDAATWVVGNHLGQNTPLNGAIDDVRVWSTLRTQSEIQANMNSEITGTESGLLAYWKFNEGSGQVAADSSPNSRTGTLGTSSGSDSGDPAWV